MTGIDLVLTPEGVRTCCRGGDAHAAALHRDQAEAERAGDKVLPSLAASLALEDQAVDGLKALIMPRNLGAITPLRGIFELDE